MTVAELKKRLEAETGMAAGAQRLIFKGRVLQDDGVVPSGTVSPDLPTNW